MEVREKNVLFILHTPAPPPAHQCQEFILVNHSSLRGHKKDSGLEWSNLSHLVQQGHDVLATCQPVWPLDTCSKIRDLLGNFPGSVAKGGETMRTSLNCELQKMIKETFIVCKQVKIKQFGKTSHCWEI